jgi:hypothetical protein
MTKPGGHGADGMDEIEIVIMIRAGRYCRYYGANATRQMKAARLTLS